jgi:hypothetical protein
MQEDVATLKNRIVQIESELERLKSSESSRQEEQRQSAFLSLIAEAESVDPKLASSPSLTIAVRPKVVKEIPKLFVGPNTEIVQLLDGGVEERSGGFNLGRAYSESKIVRGFYRMVTSAGHSVRIVTKEAACVFVAAAGTDFLSWAMRSGDNQIAINPIAITEYSYSVAVFIRKVAELGGLAESQWQLVTEWRNVKTDGSTFTLPTGRFNTPRFLLGGLNVEEMELRSNTEVTLGQSPEELGYKILKAIYNQAGASDSQMPYTVKGEEKLDMQGLYAQ